MLYTLVSSFVSFLLGIGNSVVYYFKPPVDKDIPFLILFYFFIIFKSSPEDMFTDSAGGGEVL